MVSESQVILDVSYTLEDCAGVWFGSQNSGFVLCSIAFKAVLGFGGLG